MDEEDYREKFVEQLSGSYGQMESVLGADGYKVFIDDHKADQQRSIAWAARQKSIANAINILTFFAMMAGIPTVVWLWRWALS